MSFKRDIKAAIPHNAARFLTPGHKGKLARIDVTETFGTDDLREPSGIIAAAQARAAKVFGAGNTFFLVGGSSLGNQAMIYSAFLRAKEKENSEIIVNEGCHISVINACHLLGITPVFARSLEIPKWSISDSVPPEEIARLVRAHPSAIAVLITSPTYFGVCSDVQKIAEICHENDIPLLVDQAHGAHLHFHEKLPIDAIKAGADSACMSAHKTLPALTQTAYLHMAKSSLITAKLMQEALNVFQTTSPSYIFIESLDSACAIMERSGKNRLNWLIQECEKVRNIFPCLDGENIDPTRLVFKGDEQLLRRKGIWVEQQFGENIVLIPTICNTRTDFRRLRNALR